ncbi:MAG TPA: hypothetical protein VGX46_04145 [Vicinamibacterales bacterium]|nr:hypothetical protein [Vicinamibacterales bacterium]
MRRFFAKLKNVFSHGSGIEQAEELHRDERSIPWVEQTLQDARYALRTLLKSPGFRAVALLTVALGIGANIAIFTIVNAVLLRPLPFPEPERLVRVFDDLNSTGAKDVGLSVRELDDLRDRSGLFESVSVIFPVRTALRGSDRAERIEMLGTSFEYFRLLGASRCWDASSNPRMRSPVSPKQWSSATDFGAVNSARIRMSSAGASWCAVFLPVGSSRNRRNSARRAVERSGQKPEGW